MHHIVSLSGGTASAVAADRAIARYGRDAVTLWFADTSWEDEDLYRFVADCMGRWGGELITHRDGRTPLQVAEDEKMIPNQHIAICSRVLKQEPFRAFLKTVPKPVTVLLGLDWREQHRHEAPRRNYEQIEGVTVDYPLMWKPYGYDYSAVVRSWGIEPPRLYDYGFPHNNCGGRCVRQGMAEWRRLRVAFPERFAEVRDWEAAQRAEGGPRADRTILRDRSGGTVTPLTLAELEARGEPDRTGQLALFDVGDDRYGCFCDV
jgi:hypothetical protein